MRGCYTNCLFASMFLENLHSWVSLKLGASLCSRGCESAEDAGRDMVFLVQHLSKFGTLTDAPRWVQIRRKKKKKAYPTRSGLSLWHIFNPVYMVACPRAACLFTIFLDCFHWLQSFTEGKEILRGFTSACGAAKKGCSRDITSSSAIWQWTVRSTSCDHAQVWALCVCCMHVSDVELVFVKGHYLHNMSTCLMWQTPAIR